ncbi:MAG: hypothetical protein JNK49_09250 [Planctomycetes bacterium]|nr:hypothetical protein [Planctomycetota bacterium]
MPTEDAASYLWMAEQFAAGQAAAALGLVFPPGWPLAMAPFVWLGGTAEWVGAWLGALALGATVPAVRGIAERLRPGAGPGAALCFAFGPLLPRMGAELFSEPLFLLVMAWGTWWGIQGRSGWCGLLAGVAYWIRPEGVLLAVAFAAVQPRRHLRALWLAAVAVLALPTWRFVVGLPWHLLPLHTFHEQRDDLPERGAWLRNLVAMPGPFVEAFGLASLLLLAAALRWRRTTSAERSAAAPLWLGIALQVAAVASFVVRRRFFLSAAVPVATLAGAELARAPRRVRALGAWLLVGSGLWINHNGLIPASRQVERELGHWLAAELPPAAQLVSDLPRVAYFAGRKPPEPRHFTAAQLVEQAAAPNVRVVVLATQSRRSSAAEAAALLAAPFEPWPLPEPLAERCARQGFVVLRRR